MEIILAPALALFVASLVLPWGRPLKWGASVIAIALLTMLGWGFGSMAFSEPRHHGDALGTALSLSFFMLWSMAFASGMALRLGMRFVGRVITRRRNAARSEL